MTNEQREAIDNTKVFIRSIRSDLIEESEDNQELANDLDIVLSLIKENQNTIEELKEKLILENKAKNKAEEECKRLWYISSSTCYYDMQAEIKQKDKQIDLMAELVYKRFKAELLLEYGFENEEQLKQYFADLVEKE